MKLATLCYLRRNGETLMLLRNKKANDIHEGKWNGLGGKLHPGETPEACVRREVREESGLILKSQNFCGFLTFPRFTDNEDWYVFVFSSTDFSGELIDSPEGQLTWIPDGEICSLPLWLGDYWFLPWVMSGLLFSARFSYEDKILADWEVKFYSKTAASSCS